VAAKSLLVHDYHNALGESLSTLGRKQGYTPSYVLKKWKMWKSDRMRLETVGFGATLSDKSHVDFKVSLAPCWDPKGPKMGFEGP
jgi:hypothetical protein